MSANSELPFAKSPAGYSALSVALHWLAAILVVALFLTHEGGRDSAQYAFHVGVGAIAGLLLLWRVAHRAARGMVARPSQGALLNALSLAVLWGFLVCIVIVVISGYLLPWTLGRPLDVLGVVAVPSPLDRSPWLHELMEEVHEVSGHLFVPLLALHLLGAAKHGLIRRDGVVSRMFKPIAGGR